MRAARTLWALAPIAGTWVADEIHNPGTRHCWVAPRFTYEEQD